MTDAELAAIEARLAAAQPQPEDLPANQDARGYHRLAELALCDAPVLVAEVRRLQDILAERGIGACGCSTRVDWMGKRVECCEACA